MNQAVPVSAQTDLQQDAVGFVLAGGQSSRMGRDKALASFAGQPLIANALSILREAGLSAFIAGARSSLAAFAPVIEDAESGHGPLAGICTALAFASVRHAIFLPVDLPLLPSSLLVCLLHHARTTGRAVTLSSVSGVVQTFPAVLDRAVLPLLRAELTTGRRGCRLAFQSAAAGLNQPASVVAVELLAQCGQAAHPAALPPLRWFLNVNTPDELDRAQRAAQAIA